VALACRFPRQPAPLGRFSFWCFYRGSVFFHGVNFSTFVVAPQFVFPCRFVPPPFLPCFPFFSAPLCCPSLLCVKGSCLHVLFHRFGGTVLLHGIRLCTTGSLLYPLLSRDLLPLPLFFCRKLVFPCPIGWDRVDPKYECGGLPSGPFPLFVLLTLSFWLPTAFFLVFQWRAAFEPVFRPLFASC